MRPSLQVSGDGHWGRDERGAHLTPCNGSAGQVRRTGRLRQKTMRGAAVALEDVGEDSAGSSTADSDRDEAPRSVREKNRQAQRRFRERQKVPALPPHRRYSSTHSTVCLAARSSAS